MTYEQLLELGEQVGHVEKGFTSSEVEVKFCNKLISFRKFLLLNTAGEFTKI
jgi:hypothetical protein